MTLTIQTLVDLVGRDAFDAACDQALATANGSTSSDVPHDVADRLWHEGDESLSERLAVAAELYWRMPCYANLMYWRHRQMSDDAAATGPLWQAYREFLGSSVDAIAEPAAYSLWVDWFEDESTVDGAWIEVSSIDEPRRPRLEHVVAASGPVPWRLKRSLYLRLAKEPGWESALVDALYGSCVDLYGSLDRQEALLILEQLQSPPAGAKLSTLQWALRDASLPATGPERRALVARRS